MNVGNGELGVRNGDQGSKGNDEQPQVTVADVGEGENQLTVCQLTESLWDSQ